MRSPAYSVGATHGHELQIVAVAMLGFPVLRSERIGTQVRAGRGCRCAKDNPLG
jgi:hypothetical protein